MRILLVNPPWRKSTGAYGVRAGSRWPFTVSAPGPKALKYIPFPFFLAYAAALLEKIDGTDVLAIDAIAEGLSEEEYRHRVRVFGPQFVVAETSAASFAVDMAHRLGQAGVSRVHGGDCRTACDKHCQGCPYPISAGGLLLYWGV